MSEMIGSKKNDASGLSPEFEVNPYERLDDLLFNPDLEYIVSIEDDYLKIALAQFLNDNNLQQKTKNYKEYEYMFISFDLGTFNFIDKPTLGDKKLYELPYDWDELMINLREYLEEHPFEKKEEVAKNPESWSQPMSAGNEAGEPGGNDGKSFLERAKAAVTGAKVEATDERSLYEMLGEFNGKMCEVSIDSPGASESLNDKIIIHGVSPSEVLLEIDGVRIEVDKLEIKLEDSSNLTISKSDINVDIFLTIDEDAKKEGNISDTLINLLTGVKENTEFNSVDDIKAELSLENDNENFKEWRRNDDDFWNKSEGVYKVEKKELDEYITQSEMNENAPDENNPYKIANLNSEDNKTYYYIEITKPFKSYKDDTYGATMYIEFENGDCYCLNLNTPSEAQSFDDHGDNVDWYDSAEMYERFKSVNKLVDELIM